MGEVVTSEVLSFPVAVIRSATQEEMRSLALERQVVDEAYIQKYNPYFWPAEASSTRLDAHGSRMAVSTLKNYAAEAEAGVSFLYSHDNREIVGRSMGGRFVNAQGNGVARFAADFFAVPGLQLGSVSSDQIIFAIDSKMLRDVSVGFYGGEWICSICGRDIWGYECRHWPLMKYEVEHDGKAEEVICTADVEDAHLAEVSGVYKGSTPGAAIGKAEREAKDGRLSPEVRRMLETRFRMHLPNKAVRVPGHKERSEVKTEREAEPNPTAEEATQAEEAGNAPAAQDPSAPPASDAPSADEAREVAQLLTRAGVAVENVKTAILAARALAAECERLRPLADAGTQYRADLTEAVVGEAVRAGFGAETYRGLCAGASIEMLKRMHAELGGKASEIFKPGRQTVDSTDETDAKKPAKRKAPAAAFQV